MSKKLEIGALFAGKYRILELIGQGGYGVVYRACQENIPRDVALKIMLPDSADENQIKRFRREAQHISQLKHHNTIIMHDFGYDEVNGIYYIVMEMLEGYNLAYIIDHYGALEPHRAYHVCAQILRSLGEAHEQGLIHRDLKPENIFLLDRAGEVDFVKVLDFGIARGKEENEERLTVQGTVVGTPWYMAPEQALGREVTTATDVYAVGLLFYEMLTGHQAFQGDTAYAVLNKHVTEPIIDLPGSLAHSPYNQLIKTACAKKPSQRYPDAGAFLKALLQCDPEEIRTAPMVPLEHRVDEEGSAGATLIGLDPALVAEDAMERPEEGEPTAIRPAMDVLPDHPSPPARWGPVVASGGDATMVVSSVPAPTQRLHVGPPPFVARQDELHKLQSLVDYVLETRTLHMVLVDGEIGVGKTRLWEELQRGLSGRDDLTVISTTHRKGGAPLAALRQIILDVIEPGEYGDESLLIRADQLVYQHSSGAVGAFLVAFFNRSAMMPQAGELDMEDALALWRIFEHLLRAAAERRPLFICLDDMQWTDELTAHFIHYLTERLQIDEAAIGLVMMIRPGVVFGKPEVSELLLHIGQAVGDRFFILHLSRLPPAEFRAFLQGIAVIEEPVYDALWRLSAGNPWFAAETLYFACRANDLQWSGDRWVAGPNPLRVPPALLARAEMALESLIPPRPEQEAVFWALLQWIALLDNDATHTAIRTGLRRDPRGADIRLLDVMLGELLRAGVIGYVDQGHERRFHLNPRLLGGVVLTFLDKDPLGAGVREFADHLRGQ